MPLRRHAARCILPPICAVLVATLAAAQERPPAPPPPPSILLVTIDTLRADRVGCYGYGEAETPSLDLLAAQGTLFDRARTHVPLTLPSHATILTGRLPPRTRVRGNGLFQLPDDVPTLAEVLRDAGWDTAAVVSSVVLDRIHGLDRGFRIYDDNQRVGPISAFNHLERGASQVVDAVDRIVPTLEPPFFLWVHLYDPHTPYVPPDAYVERHPGRPYDGEIAFADGAFGIVWKAASTRADGSLVVVATSDHGESLGEHGENQHGYTLHRGVLRVPLLVAGPGLPVHAVVADTVGLVDLAPTLADLAGVPLPGADGRSLRPLLAARAADAPDPGGSEPIWEESLHPLYDSGWAPLRGLLTEEWHFVDAPRPELYDRRGDKKDEHDLAAEKPAVVAALGRRLRAEAKRLGDVVEPAANLEDGPAAREQRARLASLGYLSGAAAAAAPGERLDPKDGLPGFIAIEETSRLLLERKADEAAKLLRPHLERDRSNPRLWHQMARIEQARGDIEATERAYRRALALDPDSDFIHLGWADFLAMHGRADAARAEWQGILARNPRAVDAHLALVELAVEAEDTAETDRLLAAAAAADVRDPRLLAIAGYRAKANGDIEHARSLFEDVVALDPENATGRLELGRALLRERKVPQALAELDRCLEGPRAFECRMEMARGFLMAGDLAQAHDLMVLARDVATSETQRLEATQRIEEIERMAAER